MAINIHPSVDNGVKPGSASFTGGTLTCHCADRPVKVGDLFGGRQQDGVAEHPDRTDSHAAPFARPMAGLRG